ncbi:Protein ROOT INITIATION DEFECTIVE 3 [Chlorella vulgaris]
MEGPTVVLVASSNEGNITAWDVHTGTALTSFKTNACAPGCLSLLGRDYLVAAQLGRGGGLHFWAWHKDQPHLRSFAAEQLTAVTATRDGTFCAAGGASGAVFVWETSSGRLLKSWPAHYKAVTCLAFSDSGAVLVTGGEDTMVNAWLLADVLDATAGQQLQMGAPLVQPLHSWSDHTLPVTCLAVGAGDGAALVASGSLDRTVKLRSLSAAAVGSAPLRSVALPAAVHSLALDPGEHALYAGCSSGAIYDIQLAVGQPTQYDSADGGGSAVAAAAAAGGSACVHPVMQGHTRAVTCLGLTPDASLLVSGGEDCAVRVWDLRSRQPVRLLQNPAKGPVSALLVLSQPPYLQIGGGHVASGGSQSSKRGPSRPQPLASFCKYANAPGTLKPWEGGLVLLDGSAAARGGNDWEEQQLGAANGDVVEAAGTGATLPAVAASAAAGGGSDVAALQQENAELKEQLQRALQAAEQWGRLNAQLQQVNAMDAEGWQVASASGRRSGKAKRGVDESGHNRALLASAASHNATQPPTKRQVQRSCALVDDAAREIAATPFWQRLTSLLEQLLPHCAVSKLQHMVMYGLGSLEQPGAVHIRYQLAAAQLLAAMLPLAAAAEAYDPVFTALDRAALLHCGIEVIAHDEGGRRLAHTPTLFFMPHCEGVLTDALLAANVAAGTLHNVVVLGNRFSNYKARWAQPCHAQPSSGKQRQQGLGPPGVHTQPPPPWVAELERPSTMLRLCELQAVQERHIPDSGFPVASAFNDLGLHWFPLDWRQRWDSGNECGSAATHSS